MTDVKTISSELTVLSFDLFFFWIIDSVYQQQSRLMCELLLPGRVSPSGLLSRPEGGAAVEGGCLCP